MPSAHDAALQKRESILDSVGVNLAHDVNLPTMVDGPVVLHPGLLHGELVGREIVSHDYVHILADVLTDVLGQCTRLHILSMEESHVSIPLANAYDDFFVLKACACSASLVLAADIGFVHLDGAIQHGLVDFVHGRPDAVAEVPGRLVASDPKGALDLAGRDALLGFGKKQHGHEPSLKRQVRIVENRSRCHAKLVLAVRAFKLALSVKTRDCDDT